MNNLISNLEVVLHDENEMSLLLQQHYSNLGLLYEFASREYLKNKITLSIEARKRLPQTIQNLKTQIAQLQEALDLIIQYNSNLF